MDRRRFLYLTGGIAGLALSPIGSLALFSQTKDIASSSNIVGIYVHEGWPYNHPYAARTWTLEDWRGYADGLSKLGYNTVFIWPALETMPNPLKPSDSAQVQRTKDIIDLLHREFHFRVYLTLCPNVVAYQEVADKYTFEKRPLVASTTLSDPSDPGDLQRMINWRAKLLRPLAKMDGLVIIDSDLGGYPGSTNSQFVNLLHEHRKMLDQLRPGIELVYWMHVGWAAFSSYNATGQFRWGTRAEAEDVLGRLKKLDMSPWRITVHPFKPEPNGTDLELAEKMGLASNALAFNYGAMESEPSLPITNFGDDAAFKAGQLKAPGGVVGNVQTPCAQLPNTFAFSRGAGEKAPPTEADYVEFADKLIQGHGQLIFQGWQNLAGTDPGAMRQTADQLEALAGKKLVPGSLKGLLFGDPRRFIIDLVMQLRLKSSFEDFASASAKNAEIKRPFEDFIRAADAYQKRTGYQCMWSWPKLDQTLRKLKSPAIDAILDEKEFSKPIPGGGPGTGYHNRYNDALMQLEISAPRLIVAMKESLSGLQ